ncbi:hypothetical protein WDZ92_40490, partial [Nostoc sp. NIES-2111]
APDATLPERFTKATAEATGRSERAVQKMAERGGRIGADNLSRLAGTSLDNARELDAMAKMPVAAREELMRRAEAGEHVSARDAEKAPPSVSNGTARIGQVPRPDGGRCSFRHEIGTGRFSSGHSCRHRHPCAARRFRS